MTADGERVTGAAGGGVTFRRATSTDLPAVHAIVGGALAEYGLHLLLHSSDVDLTSVERHYDERGGRLEIIEGPAGEALGILGWRPAGDVAELKKLYLTRAARGRGIGRLALERAVALARGAGCRALVLETAAVLHEAIRLYTRCGFRAVQGGDAASFATLSPECDRAFRLDLAASDEPQQ
jgi:putative acetyltransferase